MSSIAIAFTVFVIASLQCHAFAPASKGAIVTTLSAEKSLAIPFLSAPKNLDGLIGGKGFDPFGFSDFLPVKFLQEAELKHSRIAMLAVVGFIATEAFKLPGDVHSFSPVDAHNAAVSSGAMVQILALVSALEFVSVVAVKEMLDGSDRAPGDYGFDPLKFSAGKSDAVKKDLQAKEIENGRLAMLAFGGIVTQAVVTGKGFPYF